MNEQQAEKTSVSLFPNHRQIVETFATDDRRTFSNALQFIIEDWARMKRAALEAANPERQPA